MEGTPFIPRASILHKDRTVTNKVLLTIFLVLFATWVPIIIYAFYTENISTVFPNHDKSGRSIKSLNVLTFFIVVGYSMLAGVFSMLLFAAMRYIPKFSYVIFSTFWCPIVTCTLAAIFQLSFQSVVLMISSYLSCVFVFYLLHTEWLHLPEAVLKESCKAILFFPSVIGFSVLINFLALLVLVLTIVVFMLLIHQNTFIALVIQLLNVFAGAWMMMVILCLGHMSLCSTYATWFWTSNKNEIPNSLILQFLKVNIKYHLGTAAYGTSIIGAVYSFYLVIAHGINKFLDNYDATYVCFCIYNLFDAIAIRFTLIGSIVKCAINGTNYQESVSQTINDLEEHPRRCLVVTKVNEYVMIFVGSVLTLVVGLSVYAYLNIDFSEITTRSNVVLGAIFFGSLLFILPMFWMLIAAYYTILFCVIEDLEISNGTEERPYAMSSELQEAIDHNGPPACFQNCVTCCGAIDTNQRIE